MTVGEMGAAKDFFLADEMPTCPFPFQNLQVPFCLFVTHAHENFPAVAVDTEVVESFELSSISVFNRHLFLLRGGYGLCRSEVINA
jgi:hypothetical protein